jgi:hypothetical protein
MTVRMLPARGAAAAVLLVLLGSAAPMAGEAQQASVWLDANAAHSVPPSGAPAALSTYGLFGARLQVERPSSLFQLGATAGRGVDSGAGGWLHGQGALTLSRVRGVLDTGLRLEGSGLGYLLPVRLGDDVEYSQSLGAATVRPHVGLSIAGLRIGVEGTYTRGAWRAEHSATVLSGGPGLPAHGGPGPPGLPLPGQPKSVREAVVSDGTLEIIGGTASVLRILGPATLEARASSFDVANQVADGRYSSVDGAVSLALGSLDLMAGVRWSDSPVESGEIGGHAGFGVAVGNGAYVQAVAARTVSDPFYGAAGALNISAGMSVRLGRRSLGPPVPALVGSAAGSGRLVRFTLKRAEAGSVAVAGDFSGWEPRMLQRDAAGLWTLETVIEPGVYHYSFVVDGATWLVPDGATGIVDDGFGRKNATLVVNGTTDRISP